MLGLVAAALGGHLVQRSARETTRQDVRREAAAVAAALRLALDRRMAGLDGLAAFVEVNWGRPSFEADFTRYAQVMARSTSGIRTVQWIRDGIIRQTVPSAGNEAAVGLDLRSQQDTRLRLSYERAAQTRGIVLTEPRELVQGGMGLIARLGARAPDGQLLAVVAVVLDLPPLLREGGLDSTELAYQVAVADSSGLMLFGVVPPSDADPVRVPVTVPGGRWEVAVMPRDGWTAVGVGPARTFRLRIGVVTLLLIGLTRAWSLRVVEGRRARLEEASRLAGERFTRLFHLHPDGVVLTSLPEGTIVEANDAFETLTGYSRSELLGQTTLALSLWVRTEDREHMLDLVRREGVCRNLPILFRRRDGRQVEGLLSARPIDVDGTQSLLSIVRDVTEQRGLERQLAMAQRLDAIGRLAGGMAHDFNNLLTAITGYADLLLARLDDPDATRDLEQILRTAERGAELTRKLLAFARHQVLQPRVLNLNEVVRDAANLLRRLIGEDVVLELVTAPDLGFIRADPGSIEQVLMNLAVNARDAMPSGGTLTIVTRNGVDEVVLEVGDTGVGIPAEQMAHIFEPFFTTKPGGRGTGLGLAICYGLVHQAGGRIELHSVEGAGTTVQVRYPMVAPPSPEPAPESPVPSPLPRGVETILVVEDEEAVRELVERTLVRLGYTVLTAEDGIQALKVAAGFALPIHLLVTDVVMPAMGGEELGRRLRQERPGLRVVFMSGYTAEATALQAAVDAGDSFVPKPFTPAQLARQVRTVLDATARDG